ncbi:MAG: hypothetical protein PHQ58_04930 [Rhodoferax sp.]|uniref:hypothetical protein n=1 Tax=Rhodoferax sp. TaxID=50421 RepID=UPI002609AF9B|nr:hypothetical protein [Rhodoferax sp.]MDD2879758.1 hypothetical protein [Rhodoferax sp.]
MASGKLGKVLLTANQWALVYKVPQGNEACFNINVVNVGTATAKVYLAITDTGVSSVLPKDHIESGQVLEASGVLERTGIVCQEGESVYAFSDKTDIAVRVHGFEDTL